MGDRSAHAKFKNEQHEGRRLTDYWHIISYCGYLLSGRGSEILAEEEERTSAYL